MISEVGRIVANATLLIIGAYLVFGLIAHIKIALFGWDD